MDALFAWLKRAYATGSLISSGLGATPANVARWVTLAEINSGTTLVPAPGPDLKLRFLDAYLHMDGTGLAAYTSIDVMGIRNGTSVKLLSLLPGGSGAGAFQRGGTNSNILFTTNGMAFQPLDINTPITLVRTGSPATGGSMWISINFTASK